MSPFQGIYEFVGRGLRKIKPDSGASYQTLAECGKVFFVSPLDILAEYAKIGRMITYRDQHDGSVLVILDGEQVGVIREHASGFRYYPNGSKVRGESFPTLDKVKRSLEAE